ncbi:aldo/keto reductase [Brachybacterium endophyticum]|uniref:Aldo/keto reductase n=1 Tax=Brachybacterium endophyticum TaxID=2182385 RepID=A0A2U2RKI3_9MICO|nr:aldo/keto reductase [Brachybacterium endophyticum]PWH06377.1 aldo/keto reductase [Brachybacterium endophyticum]
MSTDAHSPSPDRSETSADRHDPAPDRYDPSPDRYETTAYRRVGDSGLRLPPISLGFWQNFGEERDLSDLRAIVRRAFDLGVTHFDLANNYGPPPGSAETNLGRILAQDFSGLRDELVISSKAGYGMWEGPYGDGGSRKYLLSSLDQSLARLGLEYVDIFYHHREDPETPLEETMGALAHGVRSGKALYAGISNYSPEHTREAARILEGHGVPLLIHQPSYSMFNRHVENGLLETAADLGIGLAVFSPLQQGLLTGKYLQGVPADSRAGGSSPFLSAEQTENETYLERVRGLSAIAERRGQSLARMALAWVLRHRQVSTALVGASSVRQLEQNVQAAQDSEFTDAELAAIDEFAVDGTGRR